MQNPLDIYSSFQRCLQAQDYEYLGDVVDLQGYTENCLGLTGWTTGFEVALQNWARNILAAFSDLEFNTEDVIEGGDAVVVRARVEGTHIGTFLGVPGTGRRIAWDNVAMVHTRDGRVTGQWIQADLWGIYRQITSNAPESPKRRAAESAVAWAHSAG